MTIKQEIKYHLDNKKFCKVVRQVSGDAFKNSSGYIIDKSANFILMQEVYDFRIFDYLIFPISTISQIRFNNNDKYYDKIMNWEKQVNNVTKKHDIDLPTGQQFLKRLRKLALMSLLKMKIRMTIRLTLDQSLSRLR